MRNGRVRIFNGNQRETLLLITQERIGVGFSYLVARLVTWLAKNDNCPRSKGQRSGIPNMYNCFWPPTLGSYCSRSRRRRFTVLDLKSLIYGHFQQHLYCACAEKLFMNFRYKLRHRRSIRWPRFPIGVQNFGDLAMFTLISAFYVPNIRHISTSGLFDLLTYKVYHPRRPPRR